MESLYNYGTDVNFRGEEETRRGEKKSRRRCEEEVEGGRKKEGIKAA